MRVPIAGLSLFLITFVFPAGFCLGKDVPREREGVRLRLAAVSARLHTLEGAALEKHLEQYQSVQEDAEQDARILAAWRKRTDSAGQQLRQKGKEERLRQYVLRSFSPSLRLLIRPHFLLRRLQAHGEAVTSRLHRKSAERCRLPQTRSRQHGSSTSLLCSSSRSGKPDPHVHSSPLQDRQLTERAWKTTEVILRKFVLVFRSSPFSLSRPPLDVPSHRFLDRLPEYKKEKERRAIQVSNARSQACSNRRRYWTGH